MPIIAADADSVAAADPRTAWLGADLGDALFIGVAAFDWIAAQEGRAGRRKVSFLDQVRRFGKVSGDPEVDEAVLKLRVILTRAA